MIRNHSSLVIFFGLISSLTESIKISAPAPGIDCRPDSFSLERTSFVDDFYFGLDGNVPAGKTFDFVTIVLHELSHGLGFVDGILPDGNYYDFSSHGMNPFIFDHNLWYNNNHLVDLSSSPSRPGPELVSCASFGALTITL